MSGADESFFSESKGQSRVKAQIVAEFFFAWAQIIGPTARRTGGRIAYVDLFAGPGRYDDGTKSTPMLVLERAIADPRMRQMLVAMLNDATPALSESLETAIVGLPGIETLKYQPKIYSWEVGDETIKLFETHRLVPTFTFIDPFGYKGLSLPLIRSLLKDWGSDCVFFFNFNRINMGLTNPAVEAHMKAIFGGDRLANLRAQLEKLDPVAREMAVMEALEGALHDFGGKHVVPFRFRREDGRVSHYLIFVTKDFKGYEVMKDIMARHSSSQQDGVASFEYDPQEPRAQAELHFNSPIDDLGRRMLDHYAGQRLSVRAVFEDHSPGELRHVMRNYQEALRRLEASGQVRMEPPADKRRKRHGEVTLAQGVTVIFPTEPAGRVAR